MKKDHITKKKSQFISALSKIFQFEEKTREEKSPTGKLGS